ncbi:SLAP domain-containing protein [Lacticaseibacillus zhaodongensis]|uniref:SLAP domain-containing protein n=1 Tax=Lacticaseibacillus zhaodongensis TaxID=2668065 RepID=UPI0012D316EC|nr:hypothetical protein [Lacticaseibacillus zhaodongensis]
MKNFKHSFKSNNKMKLATVAASAIMLAPVAMTSVSTFADFQNGNTLYPEYNIVLNTVSGNNQNGTNGDAQSSGLGATIGFDTSDVTSAMNTLSQIPTSTSTTSASTYTTVHLNLVAEGKTLSDAATKAQTDFNHVYKQLSETNQKGYAADAKVVNDKLTSVQNDLKTADTNLFKATQTANTNASYAAAHPTDQTAQAKAADSQAQFDSAVSAYKAAAANFSTWTSAVNSLVNTFARKTDNGAVAEAARAALDAMNNMPAGAAKNAVSAKINAAQGAYYRATRTNFGAPSVSAAAIDKAAAVAVKALNDAAGMAFTNGGIKGSSQVGVAKINYPAGYGIQIWTKDGKAVRYNSKEAATTTVNGKAVKTGDAKKLPGQKSFKVFAVDGQKTVTMNGTTYYNLGGDQYIDAAYVTFTAVK